MDNSSSEKYSNLDGLRTAGAFFVLLMHVAANGNYNLGNSIMTRIIANGGEFVKMFFILSAFGMSCGYYEKFKNGQISLNEFFIKRYRRVLPFFALLVLLDLAVSHENIGIFYEAFADLTLMFGFFPGNDIEVIGVGWTLGVIFAFYCLFPFFVFTIWTKRRAWFSMAVSLGIFVACHQYFLYNGSLARCNFIRWSCFFVAGGLIFLYRSTIVLFICKRRTLSLVMVLFLTFAWLFAQSWLKVTWLRELITLILFAAWIIYAISVKSRLLSNNVMKFGNKISFEVYLCHMLVYRVAEKLGILHLSANELLSYFIATVFVISGSIFFAYFGKKACSKVTSKIIRMVNA